MAVDGGPTVIQVGMTFILCNGSERSIFKISGTRRGGFFRDEGNQKEGNCIENCTTMISE